MKFKYMLRGLGLGILITAVVMGAYTRSAVADARVSVLKEYGLGEDNRLPEETTEEQSTDVATAPEPTEPPASRDEEKEAEIQSVLDAAKDAEQTDSSSSALPESEEQPTDTTTRVSDQTTTVVPTGESDAVQIDITKGDDSGTVSRKLFNAAEESAFLSFPADGSIKSVPMPPFLTFCVILLLLSYLNYQLFTSCIYQKNPFIKRHKSSYLNNIYIGVFFRLLNRLIQIHNRYFLCHLRRHIRIHFCQNRSCFFGFHI